MDFTWDWPSELQGGPGLRKALVDLSRQLSTLQDDDLGASVAQFPKECGRCWARGPVLNEFREMQREATEAQLSYILDGELENDWWEAAWSDAYPPARVADMAVISAQRETQRQQIQARRIAGAKIVAWLAHRAEYWRARQQSAIWPMLHEIGTVVKGVTHLPSEDVAKLIIAVEGFLRGELPASTLRSLGKEAQGKDTDLRARTLGIKLREEAERTKEIREAKREEKRRRGQQQQERLAQKAERLKKARGGLR
jgi:hypothetical protein